MRVLVIEDDAEVRGMVCKMLNGEGFDAIAPVNGKEGIYLLSTESNIDLVITDLIMPEKDGIETIYELRQDFPHIPILAISGGGEVCAEDCLSLAKKLGADVTLFKPFRQQELLEAVRELSSDK